MWKEVFDSSSQTTTPEGEISSGHSNLGRETVLGYWQTKLSVRSRSETGTRLMD